MKGFIATVSKCVQVGTDTWQQKHTAKSFGPAAKMMDVVAWAESLGLENVTVSDITFCDIVD